jgi:hypothetical protein
MQNMLRPLVRCSDIGHFFRLFVGIGKKHENTIRWAQPNV